MLFRVYVEFKGHVLNESLARMLAFAKKPNPKLDTPSPTWALNELPFCKNYYKDIIVRNPKR